MSAWQPIATAPEATYVLLFVPNYGINIGTGTKDPNINHLQMWFMRGDDFQCFPTHWMSLPDPPSPGGTRTP